MQTQVLRAMKALLQGLDSLQALRGIDCHIAAELKPSKQVSQRVVVSSAECGQWMMAVQLPCALTPEVAMHIAALWADPGVQRAYEHRAAFHLDDSSSWFFDKAQQLADPDYVPSVEVSRPSRCTLLCNVTHRTIFGRANEPQESWNTVS